MVIGGFELAIVVEILLSALCSKDWNEKRGGDSQTPKVLKISISTTTTTIE